MDLRSPKFYLIKESSTITLPININIYTPIKTE
jgi:hypothetical protein